MSFLKMKGCRISKLTYVYWMIITCHIQWCRLFIFRASWTWSFLSILIDFRSSDPMASSQLCLPLLCIPCDLKYQIKHSVQLWGLSSVFLFVCFMSVLIVITRYGHTCAFTFIIMHIHIDDSHIWVFAYSFSTFAFMRAIYTWLPVSSLFIVIHLPDKFIWTKFWYIEPFKTRINNQFWFIFTER